VQAQPLRAKAGQGRGEGGKKMKREKGEERKERRRISLVIFMVVGLMILSTSLVEAKENVKIAILDSGCNITYKEGISLIDRTVKDYNGHGTLMARIIKEKMPSIELYIVKVMDKDGLCPNEEAVVSAVEWAVSKEVNLINMSLRLRGSDRLHKAISKAYEKGIVIIAAAGNAGSRIALLNNEGGFNLEEVAYPAKYNEVIAVGAIDRYGRVYDGSIKGEEVEVVCRGYKGKYAGTSIASAYATGIIANIFSENPNLGPEELRWFIHQEAKKSRGELK
jgi:subtilisin